MTQSPPVCISFQDAINQTKCTKRILLLGNGFSIAVHSKFKYASLYDKVSQDIETKMKAVDSIFRSSNHKDFEKVSHFLQITSEVLRHYKEKALANDIDKHRKLLAEFLIKAVNSVHPKRQNVLCWWYREMKCQEFLSHFIGNKAPQKGAIYTLNYDLLLYWVLIGTLQTNNEELKFPDGFRSKCGRIWSREDDQNIFFLHGNLCLRMEPIIEEQQFSNTVWNQAKELMLDREFPSTLPVKSGNTVKLHYIVDYERNEILRQAEELTLEGKLPTVTKKSGNGVELHYVDYEGTIMEKARSLVRGGKFPLCVKNEPGNGVKLYYIDDKRATLRQTTSSMHDDEPSPPPPPPVSLNAGDVLKLRYLNKNSTILDQAEEFMREGKFPLFVSEGSANYKLIKIESNAYLRYCYEQFLKSTRKKEVSLFIFGCSLDPSDDHIWDAILKSKCEVFISTRGILTKNQTGTCPHCSSQTRKFYHRHPGNFDSRWLNRNPRPVFFCAESAKVWG